MKTQQDRQPLRVLQMNNNVLNFSYSVSSTDCIINVLNFMLSWSHGHIKDLIAKVKAEIMNRVYTKKFGICNNHRDNGFASCRTNLYCDLHESVKFDINFMPINKQCAIQYNHHRVNK